MEYKEPELKRLIYIYDWVHNNIRYPASPEEEYYSAYETLGNGGDNCLGQAHLVYLISRKLEKETYLLKFINGSVGHAVNLIGLEGSEKYLTIDTTIGSSVFLML